MASKQIEPKYPIFEACCRYTKDDFWIQIFRDMSKGKMPYGIHISDGHSLTTHYKNKNFSYTYENLPPDVIFTELKELLVDKFGLRSDLDNKEYQIRLSDNLTDITSNRDKCWKSIKRCSIQQMLVIKYILRMASIHNLDHITQKNLLTDLTIHLIEKTITSEEISMKNLQIDHISCIHYEDNHYTITPTKQPKKTNEKKIESNLMLSNFIKGMNKNPKEGV